ncbi:MAG: hypothetical protein JXA71_11150 [Chitinispirillaceae bacterium]|nr:hypothetical protein [Chitinispirillaceae bacterium]
MARDHPTAVPSGSADPSVPRELNAGPLSLIVENGWIRCVRLGNVEIIRRIYFAIRDPFWNTIPGSIEEYSLQRNASSFLISFASRHRRADIDFLWRAEIIGKASGEIRYAARGIVLSAFRKNRIGFCILHPLSTCKGIPCRIETVDGSIEERPFPLDIAPHPIFRNIRALSYAVASGLDATVRFEGDTFETEDQRNWTDATYKTYSTPRSLPVPVQLETGTLLYQKVTVNLDKPTAALIHLPLSLQLELSTGDLSGRLPRIGVMETAGIGSVPAAISRIRALGLSHFRADLFPGRDDLPVRTGNLAALARALDCPIELALHFDKDPGGEAIALADCFRDAALRVTRFLVFRAAEKSVSAETVAAVATTLRAAVPAVTVAGGTDGYFVEINRNRPPVEQLDSIVYAATPQVHTFDKTAIMDNLPGLQETLDASAAFAPKKQIIISPITLRPRENPLVPGKDGGHDERQSTLFAASWLAGVLAYCTLGNAAAVTIGEMSGPGGYVSRDGSGLFPLSFPLALIAAASGAPAECRRSSDPERVIALQWRHRAVFSALVINLSGKACRVRIRGIPENSLTAVLDTASVHAVTSGSDPLLEHSYTVIENKNGACLMDLAPYAMALLRGTR